MKTNTNTLANASITTSYFNRFDQELIDKYFNEEGKRAIDQYVHQKTIEARIDEQNYHLSMLKTGRWRSYGTEVTERLAELQASLNTEGE